MTFPMGKSHFGKSDSAARTGYTPAVDSRNLKRGIMKCFQCRESCARTDGRWHEGEIDQVYLCKACGLLKQGVTGKPS
jgi:hypothetical protein